MAEWESAPPVSVTSAPALEKSTDHTGEVIGQTRTSPGRSLWNSPSCRITRTGPR